MGRIEKRPDSPRVRGELSRSAETALWAVVEDLENLQQNVLRSLQEEIKRLQADKERLYDDIQKLLEEKEHLQQVRQITEQQVLIRQLAEVLAKHISSQLQSSLKNLANELKMTGADEQAVLKSAESNEQIKQMLGSLDDTLTITFNSLQQELKNYQGNLSQQLARMQSQQQQGETIVEELVNHLRGELTKAIKETTQPTKPSPPTVLQPDEPKLESAVKVSPPTVLQSNERSPANSFTVSSATVLQPEEPQSVNYPLLSEVTNKSNDNQTTASSAVIVPPVKESPTQPISIAPKDFPPKEKPPEPIVLPDKDVAESTSSNIEASEQNAVLRFDVPETQIQSPSSKASEPVSLISADLVEDEPISPPPAPARRSRRPSKPQSLSPVQIGFLLVVLSTVVSSLYNVAVKMMFHQSSAVVGSLAIERLLLPTLGNIFLILLLRLAIVVPLTLLLAPMMHPQVWQDIKNLMESFQGKPSATKVKAQRVLQLSIASGCFLFLSQVLIYLAIGQVTTGMAIALFFIYPGISGLLSWLLFRDKPNSVRGAAIGAIFLGELLVLGGAATAGISDFSIGSSAAIFGGIAFACYVILTRVCAAKLHPVSFTLISFTTMFVLSFIGLMLPLPTDWSLAIDGSKLLEIILSAFILGVLTLLSYVLNNVGIGKLGALRSAIIGAGVPILTVVFAGLLIQENLEIIQIFGVLFVTFGAAAFGFDKMRHQVKSSSAET
ncbi:EamA family transporter [Nostoc spongiaeforme FACHB-130]|uniref:EamA family transporter n=1 Tax=Nostoc spongiaeforme FACHB-130 TaxID=1357510 RepID=A0ABR8FW48_9NOSO|nr:DMT family transporter [Nostoc spongiaeforme]MBD2594463.1 EamA family transporter [Nostoc spongiaeforme FACHB-130]